jgi:hypothetical protein
MKSRDYQARFNMIDEGDDGVAITPIMTEIYTCVGYWDDITEDQRNEELMSYAFTNFEQLGINIPEELIESIEFKEINRTK